MEVQPGQVIDPKSGSEQAHTAESTPNPPAQVMSAVAPPGESSPINTTQSSMSDSSREAADTGWRYTTGLGSEQSSMRPTLPEDLEWSAAEFIEHQKSFQWYALLALTTVLLAVVVYFLTKDMISTVVVFIAALLFGFYAANKPHVMQYHLSPKGLQIGDRFYAFQSFKSFSIVDEGSRTSIMFMPLGRFAIPITIYPAPDIEQRVVNYLGVFLPFEQHRADALDHLLRRIRF